MLYNLFILKFQILNFLIVKNPDLLHKNAMDIIFEIRIEYYFWNKNWILFFEMNSLKNVNGDWSCCILFAM